MMDYEARIAELTSKIEELEARLDEARGEIAHWREEALDFETSLYELEATHDIELDLLKDSLGNDFNLTEQALCREIEKHRDVSVLDLVGRDPIDILPQLISELADRRRADVIQGVE